MVEWGQHMHKILPQNLQTNKFSLERGCKEELHSSTCRGVSDNGASSCVWRRWEESSSTRPFPVFNDWSSVCRTLFQDVLVSDSYHSTLPLRRILAKWLLNELRNEYSSITAHLLKYPFNRSQIAPSNTHRKWQKLSRTHLFPFPL